MKDVNGQVVDVDFTYLYSDYLPAGMKAPFNLFVLDEQKSSRIASYSLAPEFSKQRPR